MKKILLLIFIPTIFGFAPLANHCIKGDIKYSVATYSDEIFLKPKYQKLLDSLLNKPVSNYLCNQEIKNLPTVVKNKRKSKSPAQNHIIEPLFISISNFDGVYAKRIYSLDPKARNPRFTCGYFHYLFIISNNEYFDLTQDTLKNKELIESKLNSSFTDTELDLITEYYKYGDICDSYTFLPATFIKKNNTILFNAIEE